jgi:hypothetical protein
MGSKSKSHREPFLIMIGNNDTITKKVYISTLREAENKFYSFKKSYSSVRLLKFCGFDKEHKLSVYDYYDGQL